MIVIPAIDLMGGNVVQLVGGVPGTERVMLPDPVAVAKSWEKKGAPALHLIDLDAAMEKGTNFQIIKEILKNTSIPVQVGGGVRSEELIRNLIAAGAARIIVGTRGILDRDWLSRMVNRYPNKIMLAIDIKYGKVLVKGWREPTGVSIDRLFSEISVLPLAGVLYTNVDIEGRTSGIDVLKTKEFILRCPHPVYVAGGIKDVEDIRLIESLGAHGAVVGMAIYTGGIIPEEIWGRIDEDQGSKNE